MSEGVGSGEVLAVLMRSPRALNLREISEALENRPGVLAALQELRELGGVTFNNTTDRWCMVRDVAESRRVQQLLRVASEINARRVPGAYPSGQDVRRVLAARLDRAREALAAVRSSVNLGAMAEELGMPSYFVYQHVSGAKAPPDTEVTHRRLEAIAEYCESRQRHEATAETARPAADDEPGDDEQQEQPDDEVTELDDPADWAEGDDPATETPTALARLVDSFPRRSAASIRLRPDFGLDAYRQLDEAGQVTGVVLQQTTPTRLVKLELGSRNARALAHWLLEQFGD